MMLPERKPLTHMLMPEPRPLTHLAIHHATTRCHEIFVFGLTGGKASRVVAFHDDTLEPEVAEIPLTLMGHVRLPQHIRAQLQAVTGPARFRKALGFITYAQEGSKAVSSDLQTLDSAPYSGTIIGLSYFAEKHAAHKLMRLGYKSFSTTGNPSPSRGRQLGLVGIPINTEIPITVYHRRICKGVYPIEKAA